MSHVKSSQTAPRPSTRSARASEPGARARILAAAEALFSERGYDGVSINAIATRAGVSKANVFHHFDSKNALYLAVLRDACNQSTALLLHHLDRPAGTIRERLTNFAREHLKQVLERPQISRLISRELLKNHPRRNEQLARQIFGENFAALVDLLRRAQQTRELRADVDPAMIAVVLIGADVFYFQARDVLRHFPDVGFATAPARYSEMLCEIVVAGILEQQR